MCTRCSGSPSGWRGGWNWHARPAEHRLIVVTAESDTDRERYLEGIALFNQREYFEAHEVWEDLWREADGNDRLFYQGLIQCAVSLEHMKRGNASGARRLFQRCQKRFAPLPRI